MGDIHHQIGKDFIIFQGGHLKRQKHGYTKQPEEKLLILIELKNTSKLLMN